jgi:hypothetical protein
MAKHNPHFDADYGTAVPVAAEDNQGIKALIQIAGLRKHSTDHDGNDVFELSGLKRREINWKDLLDVLNFADDERETPQTTVLVETVSRAIQDHDLMVLLQKRVKFIG